MRELQTDATKNNAGVTLVLPCAPREGGEYTDSRMAFRQVESYAESLAPSWILCLFFDTALDLTQLAFAVPTW